jgi:AsmA protein
VSVRAATGGDLDLRLSAAEATIGRLKLADMAASVLVRPGRIEASLGRAGLNKGIVKARLTLVDLTEGADLKAHGTFDGVEMATFLADLGQARWLTGLAQGQFNLETSGSTVVDLVRQSHGRAAITVRQGELVGIGLNDALRRVEKRPLLASTEWKGGRTPFETAQVNLNVGAGVGEITEGSLLAPTLRTALQGRVSLVERAVAIRALVDPTAPSPLPSPLMTLDVVGGWDDVAIVPDVKSLIERSGAAQRLLPSQIIPRSPPVANAQ